MLSILQWSLQPIYIYAQLKPGLVSIATDLNNILWQVADVCSTNLKMSPSVRFCVCTRLGTCVAQRMIQVPLSISFWMFIRKYDKTSLQHCYNTVHRQEANDMTVREDRSVYVNYRHPKMSTSIHSTLIPSVTGIGSLPLLPTSRPSRDGPPACLCQSAFLTPAFLLDNQRPIHSFKLGRGAFYLFYRASQFYAGYPTICNDYCLYMVEE